ncbi:MAG: hypothetical protein R3E67_01960 [Pseudomonadales bacterium]
MLDKNWVRNYNWLPEPGTAAYKIGEVRKYVRFDRMNDWWANNKRYYKHRFNPDHIIVKVIRDPNIAWQYFQKGEFDSFGPDAAGFFGTTKPEVKFLTKALCINSVLQRCGATSTRFVAQYGQTATGRYSRVKPSPMPWILTK